MSHSVIQSIARVRQLMDCVVSNAVGPLVENTLAIDAVMGWLEDDESRLAYGRELTYKCLYPLIGVNSARRYAGNMQFEEMQAHHEVCKRLLREGSLPDLDHGEGNNKDIALDILTDTFVLQGYRHQNVGIEPGDVVIDAGGYIGDTMVYALQQGAAEVHTFEPEPYNFGLLQTNRQRLVPQSRVFLVQKGLGQEEGMLRFASNSSGSCVTPQGDMEVEITTLDSYCREQSVVPTFIKMDIEGAEPSALLGAQETLSQHAPKLSIALYHNLSDMWTIPAIIKKIRPEYRFWVRSNHPMNEFNMYAKV